MKYWKLIFVGGLVGIASALLKSDFAAFASWYLMFLIFGFLAFPLSSRLFNHFQDKGFFWGKIVFILTSGYIVWALGCFKLLSFNQSGIVSIVVLIGAIGAIFLVKDYEKYKNNKQIGKLLNSIFWEEIIFFIAFFLWSYVMGFKPEAYGTEKFMDYGFMKSMMNNSTLPPLDIWFSGKTINYYYGGQYFATFLTKLTGTRVEITYNLMRAFIAGIALTASYILVKRMMLDYFMRHDHVRSEFIANFAGIISGFAVTIAGNMHFVLFKYIFPIFGIYNRVSGSNYWFANSTRYIGYFPDVEDKTISEFPSYSFLLGDLHAHVVNIIFVMLIIALAYSFLIKTKDWQGFSFYKKNGILQYFLCPHILFAGVILGVFKFNNFWDFAIYYVVFGGAVFFANIIVSKGKLQGFIPITIIQAIEVYVISEIIALPFTLFFDNFAQGVNLAPNHSLPIQLIIMWGLPVLILLLFLILVALENKTSVKRKIWQRLKDIPMSDLFAIIIGLCAVGLVIIPELIYVVDIYGRGHERANTMFKCTYQAYILFAIMMGYALIRTVFLKRFLVLQIIGVINLALLLSTFLYIIVGTEQWYGNVFNYHKYVGLKATKYIKTTFPQDSNAIDWIENNTKPNQVVLEANGEGYSDFEKVSAMTGRPTVLGWYGHEWLWRNNVEANNSRAKDIEMIYTSHNTGLVKKLLKKYKVNYIYVGSSEREKFNNKISMDQLRKYGSLVFWDPLSQAFIIKVN